MKKYYLICAGAGVVWAIIAYVFAHGYLHPIIWGGLIASPVIGIAVGWGYLPAYEQSIFHRAFWALISFYLAVVCFGVACGIYDLMGLLPNRVWYAVLVEPVSAVLWGVTFTGFVILFWPLTFATHWLIGRVSGSDSNTPPDVETASTEGVG